MSTIVTRTAKGSALTYAEGDANFTNLNTDKAELTDLVSTVNGEGASLVGIEDSGGIISATTVEDALVENRTAIDADEQALVDHIANTTTHGTTGDIVGTSDTQTLTTKTIVVASNTVTTAASGNLAATELNTALAELDGQDTTIQTQLDYLSVTTVASMKALSVTAGMTVVTQGYYTAGDGGGATYLIVAPQAFDGYGDHELANGNVAVLQYEGNVINANKYGALPGVAAATNSAAINAALVYAETQTTVIASPYDGYYRAVGVTIAAGDYDITTISILEKTGIACNNGTASFHATTTGVVIDTPVYDGGDSPHRNGFLKHINVYGMGSATPLIGIRLNNTYNFILDHIRLYNMADQGLQIQSKFDGSGFTGTAPSITTVARDIRAFDCLQDTTRAAKAGVFDIMGTDHEFNDCEAFMSLTRTLSDANKYNVGWNLTDVASSSFVRCRGDGADQGLYANNQSFSNSFTNCIYMLNRAEGAEIAGYKNTFDNFTFDGNGAETTNTYDQIVLTGPGNTLGGTGKIQKTTGTNVFRYGVTDTNATANNNNVIGAGVRIRDFATAAVNFSSKTTSFTLPEAMELTLSTSTTPPINTVQPHKNYIFSNGSATTVTDLTGGWAGQVVVLTSINSNTTLGNGATLQTNTGANVLMTASRPYQLRRNNLDTKWVMFD